MENMINTGEVKLTVEHLYKKYDVSRNGKMPLLHQKKQYLQALSDVSFELTAGMYGILGPNGSGKSTLMSIITGLLDADSGNVFWAGMPIKKLGIEYRRILGFMPQQQGFYNGFTGERFLRYMCVLKEISAKKTEAEIVRTADSVNMDAYLGKKISSYSGGMKQRLLLAAALLGDPKLVILDEPTAGLDPEERVRLREALSALSENKIIIVATHVVSDVESVSDKILFLKKGELAAFDTPKNLIRRYGVSGGLEDVYLEINGRQPKRSENV